MLSFAILCYVVLYYHMLSYVIHLKAAPSHHFWNASIVCMFSVWLVHVSPDALVPVRRFQLTLTSTNINLLCNTFILYLFCHGELDNHYHDVIMGAMAFQITSLTIVYSTIYSGTDQRKYQTSASLAFVRGIHRWPVNSPHKWPVTRKRFPFDDVIIVVTYQIPAALIIQSVSPSQCSVMAG